MPANEIKNVKPIPERKLVRIFMLSMLGYLLLVHVWGLGIASFDYVSIGDIGAMPWGVRHVMQLEIALFGGWFLGYQLFNLFLLYGCMVSLFFLTWHVLRGPIWMGSLAATLMMAHPMKTEAVLQLAGVRHLLPVFLSLACLAFYMAHTRWGGHGHYRLAVLTFALLTPFHVEQVAVLGVVAALEMGILPNLAQLWSRLIPFMVFPLFATIFWLVEMGDIGSLNKDLITLFLCVYPLGLLPETAQRLMEDTTFMTTAVLFGLAVMLALGLAQRERVYLITLAAAVMCARLTNIGSVDWVHFAGGGKTILVLSLVAIAFCAVVQHIFQEERWRKPIILLTSLLCVFFFGLQISTYARIRAEEKAETGKTWLQEMREWENGGGERVE